jgi:hypothetical protein
MRAQLEQFFKQHRGLAFVILALLIFLLIFIVPKIFFSLGSADRNMFWRYFIISFGACMLIFFSRQKKTSSPTVTTELPASRAYQQLRDEVTRCSYELRKHQAWDFACLIMGWIVIWIGRWSEYPLCSHPIFPLSVLTIAFLAATNSWVKKNELDASIAKCALEGIVLEKKRSGLRSSYFQDLANSYEGWGMWGFAFIRTAPSLMILFSLFNTGPLFLFADHLSQFVPHWIIHSGLGVVLVLAGLFFAKIVCKPYRWLLWKLKAATA